MALWIFGQQQCQGDTMRTCWKKSLFQLVFLPNSVQRFRSERLGRRRRSKPTNLAKSEAWMVSSSFRTSWTLSAWLKVLPTAGNSMWMIYPSCCWAWSEMPILATFVLESYSIHSWLLVYFLADYREWYWQRNGGERTMISFLDIYINLVNMIIVISLLIYWRMGKILFLWGWWVDRDHG